MKLDYYETIPQLHAAARRHRAEVIAGLFATALVWLVSFVRKPHTAHAARPHFAR